MANDNKKLEYWLELAKYDLETSKIMLKNKRLLYVGFMCHQVIEKALKGYYAYSQQKIPPYTHNLSYLAEQSNLYKEFTVNQKSLLDELEPLNIEARYPTYKEKLLHTLNYQKCKKIFKQTGDLFKWIKIKLSK